MIVLDSSIIIRFLRTRSLVIEQTVNEEDGIIPGVVRAEVMHGARNDADRTALIAFLDEFGALRVPEVAWDTLGDNLARLRRAGLPVPFPDALIATLAALNGLPVWSLDAHYAMIQPHIPGPQLFAGPTP